MLLGTVTAVAVFPLKSAGCLPPAVLLVGADGAPGDRGHVVLDAAGDTVGVDRAPALRTVLARLDDAGELLLDVPGVGEGLAGRAADEALSRLLGEPVRVVPVPSGRALEAPLHLVSEQAVDAARRGEHAAADCACSLEEPRANLVLSLAEGAPAEETWPEALDGAQIRAGEALLRVLRRPGHCLGVYAQVVAGGAVRPGDVISRASS